MLCIFTRRCCYKVPSSSKPINPVCYLFYCSFSRLALSGGLITPRACKDDLGLSHPHPLEAPGEQLATSHYRIRASLGHQRCAFAHLLDRHSLLRVSPLPSRSPARRAIFQRSPICIISNIYPVSYSVSSPSTPKPSPSLFPELLVGKQSSC